MQKQGSHRQAPVSPGLEYMMKCQKLKSRRALPQEKLKHEKSTFENCSLTPTCTCVRKHTQRHTRAHTTHTSQPHLINNLFDSDLN